jgi:hypothetical protein
MSEDGREAGAWEQATSVEDVVEANAAGRDPDEDVVRSDLRNRDIDDSQDAAVTGAFRPNCAHLCLPTWRLRCACRPTVYERALATTTIAAPRLLDETLSGTA